jgi:segregation and condensation protein A
MIEIKLQQFEGPLSLLLRLIEREEMDVTEVSIANVADQFIKYVRTKGNIPPEETADFLVVAARLLLIKSKALLPYLYPEEEEEIDELETQLKMYKEFIDAAKQVEKLIGKKKFMFPREFNRKVALTNVNMFSPPKKLTKEDMKEIFEGISERVKPVEKLQEETLDKKVNIEDKILDIQSMLIERIKVSFNKIMQRAESKTEIIVSFLAMLELMRMREVVLTQDELFTDILIEKS